MENGVCAFCGMPESTEGLAYEFIEAQNEYRVVGIGTCTEKDIVIGTYLGRTVSEVSGLTRTDIETLTLSDGVRTVAVNALEYCSSLTSVTMGEGVRTVEVRAFGFCTALCELSLGKNVEVIGIHAFWGCKALAGTFYIPAGVSSLAYDAFTGAGMSAFDVASDNTAYASLDGNLYTKDGKILIKYAPAQTQTRFVIPNGVERICQGALSASALTEIVVPESVSFIDTNAFTAPALASVVFLAPDGWTTRFGNPIDAQSLADPKTAAGILTDLNDGFKRVTDG